MTVLLIIVEVMLCWVSCSTRSIQDGGACVAGCVADSGVKLATINA